MDIPFVVSEAVREGEIRFVDMAEVAKRIAIVDEPRPITVKQEVIGDVVRVNVSQPQMRFIDLKTGKIIE